MSVFRNGVASLLMLAASALGAQDIAGAWQGTLVTSTKPLRLIFQIAHTDGGRLRVNQFSIDQGGFDAPALADTVTFARGVFTATFNRLRGRYEGVLSKDGSSIEGTWKQDGSAPLVFVRATKETAWRDPSPHTTRFIAVENGVALEVLDWGGSGRPVVLLAGAGNTAHVFDQFAQKLTGQYHVYGVTRRGFGFSSVPMSGYSADRLADDVLAVIDSLKVDRPVLIGHSIAGEELSSIGSRHPEKTSGLVYLDGGYAYAFYDPAQDNVLLNIADVRRKLARISPTLSSKDLEDLIRELVDTSLPVMERDMRTWMTRLAARPDRNVTPQVTSHDFVPDSLFGGEQKYTSIHAPVLAIFAAPREIPPAIAKDSAAVRKADSTYLVGVMPQINAFERGIPGARVVRIPHSNHYVFRSNEAEVLREIRSFVDGLSAPQPVRHQAATGITYLIDSLPDGGATPNALRTFVGSVAFAAGRGRMDVIAKSGAPPIAINGVTVAPILAQPGDYYLFDSTGFILVRPATKTFSSFIITDQAYSFTDGREGWPQFFDFGPVHRDPISAEEMASGSRLQHGPLHVFWHLEQVDQTRGRLTVADAPPGEASVARWFGMTQALANWSRSPGAIPLRPSIQLTSVSPLAPPDTGKAITNFITLHWSSELKQADVDLMRLMLPSGYTETGWPGYERAGSIPAKSSDQGAKWRTLP